MFTICGGRIGRCRIPDATAINKGKIKLINHLGGTADAPTVLGLRETSGPTNLTNGAIADGQHLKRSGSTVIGSDAASLFNHLINSDFVWWQRHLADGLAVTADRSQADDTYACDRWYVLTQTAAINVKQVTAETVAYAARLTQSQASAQRMGLAQIIEGINCKHLRGQSIRLQARIKISNSQAVRIAVQEWTGTEDAVTSDIVNTWTSGIYTGGNFWVDANFNDLGNAAVTPSAATWTDIGVNVTVGSSMNNLVVFLWTEGTAAQNVTLDISECDLFIGAADRPWRPLEMPWPTMHPDRYCQWIGDDDATIQGILLAGYTTAGGSFGNVFAFRQRMRVAPTVTKKGTWSAINCSQPVVNGADPSVMAFTTDATATGGLATYSDSAGDGFIADAEL